MSQNNQLITVSPIVVRHSWKRSYARKIRKLNLDVQVAEQVADTRSEPVAATGAELVAEQVDDLLAGIRTHATTTIYTKLRTAFIQTTRAAMDDSKSFIEITKKQYNKPRAVTTPVSETIPGAEAPVAMTTQVASQEASLSFATSVASSIFSSDATSMNSSVCEQSHQIVNQLQCDLQQEMVQTSTTLEAQTSTDAELNEEIRKIKSLEKSQNISLSVLSQLNGATIQKIRSKI